MKKIISVVLALILLFSFSAIAGASGNKTLKFNDDGKFTIVHLTDIQDDYPINRTIYTYINEMLDTIKPDLVVLGGDNSVAPEETKEDAIKELCEIFVNKDTYFTLVFGNHDCQQGWDNDALFALYKEYGGEYCLAEDAVPELHGCGTHNLPIYSSDGSKIAFNLFMFDSGSDTYDSEGNCLGYDCVHEDQINWYKGVAEELKAANGGEVVHSLVFQHIVVQEAIDALFIESPISLGDATMNFDGHSYTYLPKVGGIQSGWLLEQACPGYYNYGELDAMADEGDVLAMFSGHDHINNYTLNLKGINITNTGGCTYNSYGDDSNRGCRVIVLDEKDTTTYETYDYTLCEAALKEGSQITEFGDITETEAKLGVAKYDFMVVFVKLLSMIFFMFK